MNYVGRVDMGRNVGFDLFLGKGEVSKLRNMNVRNCDCYGNVGVCEGLEYIRVWIEEFDLVDDCWVEEVFGYLFGWWKVVCYCIIIDFNVGFNFFNKLIYKN